MTLAEVGERSRPRGNDPGEWLPRASANPGGSVTGGSDSPLYPLYAHLTGRTMAEYRERMGFGKCWFSRHGEPSRTVANPILKLQVVAARERCQVCQ